MVAPVNAVSPQPYTEQLSHKATQAAQSVQNAARTAFKFCTHPVVVYFTVSNALLAYGSSNSAPYTIGLNIASMAAGAAAFYGAVAYHSKQASPTLPEPILAEHPIPLITKENYQKEVLESKKPVVLEISATWCPPCKAVAPVFAELNRDLQDKIKFVKLDLDAEPNLAKELNVQAVPTFLFFKDGKIVDREEGATTKEGFLLTIADLFI